MKNKIKEVENYFRAKIVEGDFLCEIEGKYTARIRVDREYYFSLWIGNGLEYPETIKLSKNHENFMYFEISDEQSIILSEIILPIYKEWIKITKIEELKAELNKLQNGN